MNSRREFFAAIAATSVASIVESVESVDDRATSLILNLKWSPPIDQIQIIEEQCRMFNERRVKCGHKELPVLIIIDTRMSIEQVQK